VVPITHPKPECPAHGNLKRRGIKILSDIPSGLLKIVLPDNILLKIIKK
jgi:hypothetical protein